MADFDYMKEEIGYRVSDRVLDIKRQGRECTLLYSSGFLLS